MCSGLYTKFDIRCSWLPMAQATSSNTWSDNTLLAHESKNIFLNFLSCTVFAQWPENKNWRAGAPGCKWLVTNYKLKLAVHQYHTNPNLFLEFFYLLRFSYSDIKKKFSRVGAKKKKKKKKRVPKNEKKWKGGEIFWNAPKNFFSAFRQLFVLRAKLDFLQAKTVNHELKFVI